MTDKFKVGQRVRIVNSIGGKNGRIVGALAWIISRKHLSRCGRGTGDFYGYRLDIDGYGIKGYMGYPWCAPEDWLAPIYDGYDKTTWDDCYKVTGWKPKEVVKLD